MHVGAVFKSVSTAFVVTLLHVSSMAEPPDGAIEFRLKIVQPQQYFLRDYVSVARNDGAVGFPPGTAVEIMEPIGPRIQVCADTITFAVRPDQLTNDVNLARGLAASDQQKQEFLKRIVQVEKARALDEMTRRQMSQEQAIELRAKQLNVITSTKSSTTSTYISPLDRGAYNSNGSSRGAHYGLDGRPIGSQQNSPWRAKNTTPGEVTKAEEKKERSSEGTDVQTMQMNEMIQMYKKQLAELDPAITGAAD